MRISYSSFETYRTCPLKYKYQNVDKIKEPKSKEAVFGTLMHATLKFIHTPALIPPKLEEALDYFSRNWNSDIWADELEERAAFSQGIAMLQDYYKKNDLTTFNIVDLESRFDIDLEGHHVSGIVDRIDKTEAGYEIIDYKTGKKMPSQEAVDENMQLSVYLDAFLARYPKEKNNLDKITVSLYFLKHGVKLSAQRTAEQLQSAQKQFLEVIDKIEAGKFEPNINPLCDWCGYQKICPLWRHKFKEENKLDDIEVAGAIEEYLNLKAQIDSEKHKMAELSEKITQYMQQQGVTRVFGENGIIAQAVRKTYKYDDRKIRELLEPLGKWEQVLKMDGNLLKKLVPVLPVEIRRAVEEAKILDKESTSLTVKKK